ncbi:24568_t:CDS:2 [Cetraspora pellucida]|uniref:24568_t:CDS:1 n=1 Tax=Cetraspora pellucida TaxID=1433469 RepID=A0A9N9IEF4_9GLOM|nr:24568_t:CDS:2 [Cetraspora pellucida]
MISKYKANAQTKNDTAALYEHLSKLQQKNQNWYFKIDFEEDDYKEPQILLDIALENCAEGSINEIWKNVSSIRKDCEHKVNNRDIVKLDSKKVSYFHSFGLCKKALDMAIMSGSNKVLKDLLQEFIDDQISLQSKNNYELLNRD